MYSNVVKYKIVKYKIVKCKKKSKLKLNAKGTTVLFYLHFRHYVFTCYSTTVIKDAEGLHPAAVPAPCQVWYCKAWV